MATNNGNALARRAPQDDAAITFKKMLQSDAVKGAIARALPKHVTPDKIISATMTAVQMTPKLLDCTQASVLRSVMISSLLGLEPGGALGSAYLVPYGKTCQLIIGYRGLIDLARRSGAVKGVEARVVYDCDDFDYAYGTESRIVHVPKLKRPDGAAFIAAYCVITLADGTKQIEIMGATEIDRIRDASLAKMYEDKRAQSPWVQHYDEMARKTVVRRGLKYAPMSADLARAEAVDARGEMGEDQSAGLIDLHDDDITPPPTTADAVRGRLEMPSSNADAA